jgi:hypothetical protein
LKVVDVIAEIERCIFANPCSVLGLVASFGKFY